MQPQIMFSWWYCWFRMFGIFVNMPILSQPAIFIFGLSKWLFWELFGFGKKKRSVVRKQQTVFIKNKIPLKKSI